MTPAELETWFRKANYADVKRALIEGGSICDAIQQAAADAPWLSWPEFVARFSKPNRPEEARDE